MITLYILTELDILPDGSLGEREITGYTINPLLADIMLLDSIYGELEKRQISYEQWGAIERIING